MGSPELQGEFDLRQMPAVHMRSKYCLAVCSFSGVNRLGDVLTGGPVVSIKHSTPWRKDFAAKDVLVISGKSCSNRANGEDWTTFTPDMPSDAEENQVAMPECNRRLCRKSIVISKFCRKSNPSIGLLTWAIKNTKVYDFPLIFIFFCCWQKALIGVPFTAVRRTLARVSFGVDDVGGHRETCNPISSRHLFLEISSVMRPNHAGRDVELLTAALSDRPRRFPDLFQLAHLRRRGLPRPERLSQFDHYAGDPLPNGNTQGRIIWLRLWTSYEKCITG